MATLKGTETHKNLMRAFAGEHAIGIIFMRVLLESKDIH